MITQSRMFELWKQQKEIYILVWCPIYKELNINILKLNENIRCGKYGLIYNRQIIAEYNMCFEDLKLSYQRMNGVIEDCNFMYSYKSIEDDVL